MNLFKSFRPNVPLIKVITTAFFLLTCNFLARSQNHISSERKQLFDYNWKFFLGDSAAAAAKDFNDVHWRKLDLPHDWSIEGKVNPKNPTKGGGGYFPAGIGWYRKTFKAPIEWK